MPPVDARIAFWCGALANMGLIVGIAALGVRQVRRGDVPGHRRSMLTACALVVFFLLSYLVKRALIGGEDLDTWGRAALVNLWVHETTVMGMLIAGGVAFHRGRRLAGTRRVTGSADDPAASPEALRRHRRMGWVSVAASALGLLTACGILAGMFARHA